MSDSAGSAGHRIVLEVGHFFGHKFQPWGAVRIANIVGNAAKVATVAIPLVLAAGEVIMEERVRIKAEQARHERRRSFILEITGQAKRIASEVRASVAGSLDEVLEQSYEDISRIRQEILAGLASQTKTGERLQAICLECDRSLALLPLEDAAG